MCKIEDLDKSHNCLAGKLASNLEKITQRIENAAQKSNRKASDIQLLLATKTRSPEEINTAIALGYGLIGENRAQELSAKSPHIRKRTEIHTEALITPRETHFIGALQGNKVNEVTSIADCIQSVDRLRIARRIQNYCVTQHLKRDIMIQVNTSQEPQKNGVAPEALFELLEAIAPFDRLTIRGLMTIGLQSHNEREVREGFALLRSLSERAREKGLMPVEATELSMGMSNDLELAIAEGATIIRVGSAIFGARPTEKSS